MTFDAGAHPSFAFDRRINRRDAEDLLNVNPNTFGRAVAAGQAPAQKDGTYDRGAVLDLAADLISGSEILARWGRDGRKMPAAMKGDARPIRASHLGWPRIATEAALAKAGVLVRTPGQAGGRTIGSNT